MKLQKGEHVLRGKGMSKFSLKCDIDKEKYLNLIDILYKSTDFNAVIIKGLYDNKKDIVLKVGIHNAIKKEYDIYYELKTFPNFIRYYCVFYCNDDILKLIKNEEIGNTYNLCKNGTENVGILAMNYYKLGSIGSYDWNKTNLHFLKNLLKHTVFSILYAYSQIGFIHGDLHCDNILLKNKRENEKDYFYKKLSVDEFEIRIMDFEKSLVNKNKEFIYLLKDIEKLFNSISLNERYKVMFAYKNGMLRKLKNQVMIDNINAYTFNEKYFNDLELIIDSFYVEYEIK